MKKIINKNYLFINMSSYILLQMVNILVGIFLPRLYLAVYGSEVNGIVSTINSFITYFSYLEAGIGLTLIHSLFKPLAEKDTKEMNRILSFSKRQYQKISGMYFLLVIVLSFTFPIFYFSTEVGNIEFILLVFVIGVYGALDFYTMAKYRVLLTADRKEYILSSAMIVAQLLRFIFVWSLLQLDLSIVLVKIIPILTLVVRSIILKLYVKKEYTNINFSINECMTIKNTKNRWDALLLQISISTSISLPTMIISQVLGFKEANVYTVYILVIGAIISIISALSSGVSPMLGQSIALGEKINETYDFYDFIVAFVITVIFSITVVLILPFIKLYTNVVSDINYIYPSYAVLISIWGAIYSYRIPFTAIINAAAIYRENRIYNVINLLIQFLFGIILTKLFGVIGLLIVMIFSSIYRNIGFSIVNSKVLLHNGINKSIIRQIVMIVCILTSYYILYPIIQKIDFNIMLWIKIGIIVTMIELMTCSCIFFILDKKLFKKLLKVIKNIK